MKTQFLMFLLGIFVAISFAATTNNLLTVKPAIPISVVQVESFEQAIPYIKKGYVVKVAFGGDSRYWIILEKY